MFIKYFQKLREPVFLWSYKFKETFPWRIKSEIDFEKGI